MDVALQGTTNTYSMIRERIYETRRELEELGVGKRIPRKIRMSSAFLALGFWVFSANMGCKLFVALQLEVPQRFIERFTSGRTRRVEHPATF